MVQQEKDWIMRQVKMLVEFVARLFFKQDEKVEEMTLDQAGEIGQLFIQIKELVMTGNICDAEDPLHSNFTKTKDYLRLAMWFYNELNSKTDEELIAANFTRDEVYEGLRDVLSQYEISFPSIL